MIKLPLIGTYQVGEDKVKKIIFTMASTPSLFSIANTAFRYDKKFAIDHRFDDGLIDAYLTAFKTFKGGNVIYEDGTEPGYPGLHYTDGCGNLVAFKGSLAINTSKVNLNNSIQTSYVSYDNLNEMYAAGWNIINTGANDFGGTNDFESLPDDATRYQKALDEITEMADVFRANTGIKVVNFSAPFNSDYYDGPSYSLFLDGKLKTVGNIDGIVNTDLFGNGASQLVGTGKSWEDWLLNPYIGIRYDYNITSDNEITRTALVDTDFITTAIAATDGITSHTIITLGTHGAGVSETTRGALPGGSVPGNLSGINAEYRWLSFKHVMEEIETRWGQYGTDTVIFTNQDDLYNYQKTLDSTVLSTVISGNIVEVTCDFSNVDPSYRDHPLSLLIDSDVDITSISYENFDEVSHNIGYSGDATTALVNASYAPDYDAAITQRANGQVLTIRVEATLQQSDFDAAQTFISSLPNGSYKDDLQTRISALTITPDARVVQIDFGRDLGGYTTPFPWNNMGAPTLPGSLVGATLSGLTDSTGLTTPFSLEITASFDSYDSNVPFNNTETGLPFPYTACRDVFKTTANVPGSMRISGLDEAKLYSFTFYAYRGFTGNLSQYTIGATTVSLSHKTDIYGTVAIDNVSPEVGGFIDITVSPDGTSRAYIGVLQISEF